MIMASSTNDPVQKKMVYSYICTYAQEKPDLAILCINTLQRDCRDQDPMIRALALRSLCSLRLPNICEYALEPLRQSLSDRSSYVRRTCVLAYTKLHSFLPTVIQEAEPNLLQTICELRKDVDPLVVVNVFHAIEQILTKVIEQISRYEDEGISYTIPFGLDAEQLAEKGTAYYINQSFMLPFFNIFSQFSEWGQCTILELATKYTPQNEEEMYDIMNLLETTLSHCNSAVVLAAVKLFLHVTKNNPDLQEQVYERVKTPLITHLITAPVEIGYVILSHLKIIAIKAPQALEHDYKHFYFRYHDTSSVKKLKVEILSLIVTKDNSDAIINELNAYVFDREADVVHAVVPAIGFIAVREASIAETSIDILLSLLEHKNSVLSNASILACQNVLRKYPQKYSLIVPILQKILMEKDLTEFQSTHPGVSSTFESSSKGVNAQETTAISAIVWMLGEFASEIPAAPYVLENLINSLIDAIESSADALDTVEVSGSNQQVDTVVKGTIQTELLIACVKAFFKRPPEVQKMLGRLLKVLVNADDPRGIIDIYARQRAAFYYRMLASGPEQTAKIIMGEKPAIQTSFREHEFARSASGMAFLLEEFNTLSVIYGIPESAFRKLNTQLIADDHEVATAHEDGTEGEDETQADHEHHHSIDHGHDEPIDYTSGVYDGAGNDGDGGNTGGDDGDGDGDDLYLSPDVELDPDTFQELWGSLPESSIEFQISQQAVASTDEIESTLQQHNVYTMATGETDGVFKYYFYAMNTNIECNDGQPLVFLLQCDVVQSTGDVIATLKTNGDEEQSTAFYNIIGTIMTSL